jgi:hypothetical protein
MELKDYAELKALMSDEKKDGWGTDNRTAIWLIVAVIAIAIIFWAWHKGCDEKTQIAVGLAKLDGRVDAIEPALTAQGNNLYSLNGAFSATAQGVKDMKECFGNQLFELNDEIFYNPSRRGRNSGCCGSNREFKQTSTYNLASTNVTVDETCRN